MVAHGAQLRTPVRVESYVQPGDEARLFPGSVSYLSLDQVSWGLNRECGWGQPAPTSPLRSHCHAQT